MVSKVGPAGTTAVSAEMPAEHALLGLLALDERQPPEGGGRREGSHGYDLARRFGDGQPLGDVLRLEPGMLYHHLKKIERAGWAAVEANDSAPAGRRGSSRPPRRSYRLTAAGEAELWRWLGEPVTHTRELRLEFLVKLYFARRLAPERAARLVAEQRAILDRLTASLTAQRLALDAAPAPDDGGQAPTPPDADDRHFLRQVLDLRLIQTAAAANWLDRVAPSPPPMAVDSASGSDSR